jgi:hypothetical protein
MQGRMVDIEKLRTANETVRAVGNMNVNARGDVLGPHGQIVTSKAEVMKTYYEQPKGKVDDTPARAKPTPPRKTPPTPVQKMTPVESKPTAKPVETFKPKTPTEKKGIDAALDGLE